MSFPAAEGVIVPFVASDVAHGGDLVAASVPKLWNLTIKAIGELPRKVVSRETRDDENSDEHTLSRKHVQHSDEEFPSEKSESVHSPSNVMMMMMTTEAPSLSPPSLSPSLSSTSLSLSPSLLSSSNIGTMQVLPISADNKHNPSMVHVNVHTGETTFVLQVSPNDSVSTLHQLIYNSTDLSPQRQRLIYRGKLLPTSTSLAANQTMLHTIAGLDSGQTIHLMPLPATAAAAKVDTGSMISSSTTSNDVENITTNNSVSDDNQNHDESNSNRNSVVSVSESTDSDAMEILAQILSLTSNHDDDDEMDHIDDDGTVPAMTQPGNHEESGGGEEDDDDATLSQTRFRHRPHRTIRRWGRGAVASPRPRTLSPPRATASLNSNSTNHGPASTSTSNQSQVNARWRRIHNDHDDDDDVATTTTTTTPPSTRTSSTTPNTTSTNRRPFVLSSSSASSSSSNNDTAGSTSRRSRSSTSASYRLSAQDLIPPNPGTGESVRQALLTLHTILPGAHQMFNGPVGARSTTATGANIVSEEDKDDINSDNQNTLAVYPQIDDADKKMEPKPIATAWNTNVSSVRVTNSLSPLDIHRRWYVGQWLDVRDTVNQWLEATIVQIAYPDEVFNEFYLEQEQKENDESMLHSNFYTEERDDEFNVHVDAAAHQSSFANNDKASGENKFTTQPMTNDPIVKAKDLKDRIKLLIEPCRVDATINKVDTASHHDAGTKNQSDVVRRSTHASPFRGEYAGYCRRATNDHVQLLLIHYNGWGHRWDEWIRSDSERIRPFRVRTNHTSQTVSPSSSNADTVVPYASPTPQSHFSESPSTFISAVVDRDDNENNLTSSFMSSERYALIPELARVSNQVNSLLSMVAADASFSSTLSESTIEGQSNRSTLPWQRRNEATSAASSANATNASVNASGESRPFVEPTRITNSSRMDSQLAAWKYQQLHALAPLLDRLGRALIDSAPHLLALAEEMKPSLTDSTGDHNDRPVQSSGSASAIEGSDVVAMDDESPTSLGGLLSLLSRTRRNRLTSVASSNVVVIGDNASAATTADQTAGNSSDSVEDVVPSANIAPLPPSVFDLDPDYTDFATGVVNTTRGAVRTSMRNRSAETTTASGANQSVASDLNEAFGAYLAAATIVNALSGAASGGDDAQGLGRLLQGSGSGGGGGGGIDIRIHAVVAAPGGGTALTTLGETNWMNLFLTSDRERRSGTPRTTERLTATSSTNSNQVTLSAGVDDDGLFDELYTENPSPFTQEVHTAAEATTPVSTPSPLLTASSELDSPVELPPSENRRSSRTRQGVRVNNNDSNSRSSSATNGAATGSSNNNFFTRLFRR
jgi:hypothetical protein